MCQKKSCIIVVLLCSADDSGNSAAERCGLRNCCQNTKTRPHNLLHNLALGVSATGMAFSNQEKPVMLTNTHTQEDARVQYTHFT